MRDSSTTWSSFRLRKAWNTSCSGAAVGYAATTPPHWLSWRAPQGFRRATARDSPSPGTPSTRTPGCIISLTHSPTHGRSHLVTKLKAVTAGGATRFLSVKNALPKCSCEFIAVHDGARPLISTEDIDRVLTDAANYGASIAAAPVTDTIKICAGNLVDSTPDRDTLYAAQTPQAFRRELYLSCVDRLGTRAESLTDDSALLEACGEEVHITAVTACNMKVTRPQDLAIAAAVLRR